MAITQADQGQNNDGRMQLVWIDGSQARTKWEQADGSYTADQNLGPAGYSLDGSKPITISRNKAGLLTVVAFATLGGTRVAIGQQFIDGPFYSTWTAFV